MEIVPIVFAFIAFCVLMDTIVKILKMRTNDFRGSGKLSTAESREIQELHSGFEELTRRVESLETILLDRVQKRSE